MTKLAVITGVGPGTGAAMARRFHAGGYSVAMLARSDDRLRELESELPNAWGVACDVADAEALARALALVQARFQTSPAVVIHNAVAGAFGTFRDIDPAVLERNFQVNVMALLHLARWAAPLMDQAGQGVILATGNTSALRGRSNFAGFAPTKAAQRILAESMARDLGPKGIHVGYLLVDAVIDLAWTRARYPDATDDFFISPANIADEAWHLAHQPRTAWSFLTELRPFAERW